MSEYTDFWKALDLPSDQSPKAQAFNTVAANADQDSLTPEQQYSMAWGQEAVPEDWVKARAKEINDQINGAESTGVLKRTNGRPLTQAEKDAAAAAAEAEKAGLPASTVKIISEGGGGNGNGPGGTGSTGPGQGVSSSAQSIGLGLMGLSESKALTALSPAAAIAAGVAGRAIADSQLDSLGRANDALGSNPGGAAETGMNSVSDRDGNVSNVSSTGSIDAQDRANFGITGSEMDSDRAANSTNDSGGNTGSDGRGQGGNDGGTGSSDGPCVDPETPIMLADMTEKPAGQLVVGDLLYTMDEATREFGVFPVESIDIVRSSKKKVSFGNGVSLLTSFGHRFFMADQLWKAAQDLAAGDMVVGLGGQVTVLSIEEDHDGDVVRMIVGTAHTYISSGLISHNGCDEGGYVEDGSLFGPNPAGPDDGYMTLKTGEYVINASMVKKYGRAFIDSINNGTFKK
jgi:hypothetical protein